MGAVRPPIFLGQKISLAAPFELFSRIFGHLATVRRRMGGMGEGPGAYRLAHPLRYCRLCLYRLSFILFSILSYLILWVNQTWLDLSLCRHSPWRILENMPYFPMTQYLAALCFSGSCTLLTPKRTLEQRPVSIYGPCNSRIHFHIQWGKQVSGGEK